MTIDAAVQSVVGKFLVEKGYATKENVDEIARAIGKEVYEQFQTDVNEVREEIKKISERGDRMWDLLHQVSTPRFAWINRLLRKLCFWRK